MPNNYLPVGRLSYSVLFSLACQLIVFGVFLQLNGRLPDQTLLALVCSSFLGFLFAGLVRLSPSWQTLNLLLLPAIYVSVMHDLNPQLFLAVLLFLGLIHLPTLWTGVPYYPTSKQSYQHILGYLPPSPGFTFIDLGCGFGDLLDYLSRKRPDGRYTGAELSLLPFIVAKIKSLVRPNLRIRLKNFWDLNLGEYQVVYAFLAPGPMPRLWEKVKAEMKPGSIFITNTFEVEGVTTEKTKIDDDKRGVLYVHRF